MRKILIIIIVLLLLVLSYISLAKGIEVGNFKILSIKQIEEESQNLKTKIENVNSLIDQQYPKRISDLKTASNNMEEAKSEYLKYTNLSSDAEILEAMQKKSYAIEFLWAKIGTHARKEGVNLKFEIVSSSTGANNANDLNFTVEGSYIAITNFIYAIENDADLNFRIQNFKLLPYKDEILQATFKVQNITIVGNSLTQNIQAQSSTTNNTTTNAVENTTSTQTTETANVTQ